MSAVRYSSLRGNRPKGREKGKTSDRSAGESDAGAALILTSVVDLTERAVVTKILVKQGVMHETHRTGSGYCKSNSKSAKRNRLLLGH